jgi:hypothetical protein
MSFNTTYTSVPGDALTPWTSIGSTVLNANANKSGNTQYFTYYNLPVGAYLLTANASYSNAPNAIITAYFDSSSYWVTGGLSSWANCIDQLTGGSSVYCTLSTDDAATIMVAAQQDGPSGSPAALSASAPIYINTDNTDIYFSLWFETDSSAYYSNVSVTRIG